MKTYTWKTDRFASPQTSAEIDALLDDLEAGTAHAVAAQAEDPDDTQVTGLEAHARIHRLAHPSGGSAGLSEEQKARLRAVIKTLIETVFKLP